MERIDQAWIQYLEMTFATNCVQHGNHWVAHLSKLILEPEIAPLEKETQYTQFNEPVNHWFWGPYIGCIHHQIQGTDRWHGQKQSHPPGKHLQQLKCFSFTSNRQPQPGFFCSRRLACHWSSDVQNNEPPYRWWFHLFLFPEIFFPQFDFPTRYRVRLRPTLWPGAPLDRWGPLVPLPDAGIDIIEGSLNSKLPTIWRVEKQMKSRWDEVKSEERRCNCAKVRRYIRAKC